MLLIVCPQNPTKDKTKKRDGPICWKDYLFLCVATCLSQYIPVTPSVDSAAQILIHIKKHMFLLFGNLACKI